VTPPVIFSGPSLPRAEVEAAGFIWRPPVRQGDVRAILADEPAAIGIIDGVFECVPTVWHDEILEALDRGIPVYGAASIGALRAAELDVYGMIGVGQIYEAYRDGSLEDYDEVALLHAPEELGFRGLTASMVDVRASITARLNAGFVSAAQAASLITDYRRTFYKERTQAELNRRGLDVLGGRLGARCGATAKEIDAEALLRTLLLEFGSGSTGRLSC
jgi:hypothetical protein